MASQVAARVGARRSRDVAAAARSSRDVTAPDDGVITSRTVTVGQIAQAGNEMLRLLRNGRIEWRGEAPETRLKDLAPGQGVSVMTADGTPFHGKIRVVVADDLGQRSHGAHLRRPRRPTSALRPACSRAARSRSARGLRTWCRCESVVSADGYSYVFVLERGQHRRAPARRDGRHPRRMRSRSSAASRAGERIVDKGAGFLKDGDRVNVEQRGGRLMNFVTWSIRNPVPVIVLFIALTVAGLISFPKLGVLDRPDIEFPAVDRHGHVSGRRADADGIRDHAQGRGCRRDDRRHRADDLDRRRGRVDDEHRVPVRHRPLRRARRRPRRDDADPLRSAGRRQRADRLARRRRPAAPSSRGASRPTT